MFHGGGGARRHLGVTRNPCLVPPLQITCNSQQPVGLLLNDGKIQKIARTSTYCYRPTYKILL